MEEGAIKVTSFTGSGYVKPSILLGWMRDAEPGDRLVYARMRCLPQGCMVAAELADLAELGLVNLCQRRCDDGFAYEAQRTSRPLNNPIKPGQQPKHFVPSRPHAVTRINGFSRS